MVFESEPIFPQIWFAKETKNLKRKTKGQFTMMQYFNKYGEHR